MIKGVVLLLHNIGISEGLKEQLERANKRTKRVKKNEHK